MTQAVEASRPSAGTAGAGHAAEHGQYLTFLLAREVYAIGILAIKEIIEYDGVTSVPMMPEAVRGVINLRGAVVPVLDLAASFGRKPTEITRRTCIVIVEVDAGGETRDIGVIVDAVNEVVEIPAGEIEPAPAFGTNIRSDFIAGMGKRDGKFVIILNPDRVVSGAEVTTVAEAATGGEMAVAEAA